MYTNTPSNKHTGKHGHTHTHIHARNTGGPVRPSLCLSPLSYLGGPDKGEFSANKQVLHVWASLLRKQRLQEENEQPMVSQLCGPFCMPIISAKQLKSGNLPREACFSAKPLCVWVVDWGDACKQPIRALLRLPHHTRACLTLLRTITFYSRWG